MTVISGTMTLPRAWRQMTRASESPLTRAVVTYSWLSCSSMKLRVMRLM